MREQEITVTQKGQVTIPAEVRRALGLKARDKVIFELSEEKGVVKLRPAPSKVARWFGAVSPKEQPEDFPKVREEFEKAVAQEVTGETR
ncbi:MAG: AbrB/MazE/SpoVT family DNA-binding domain-containing protein [Anaerolineae bacterium]|nr:AbrB/MazE/SpoVT family DNA-binding domain-containing protein [Anaerolineae bacterium]